MSNGTINKVILVGNVGKDPEIRTTQDNKEIATITLATSESWRDKMTGEKKDKTEWHRISVFNENLVNIVKNYIKKGSKLYIEGVLRTTKWTDASGNDRYSTDVVLQGYNSMLVMLDSKRSNNGSELGNDEYNQLSSNNSLNEELEDDIPF